MKQENYFFNCHSEESIKIRYRKLSLELHPDKNKSPDAKSEFQLMKDQRDQALRLVYSKTGASAGDIELKVEAFVRDLDSLKISSLNDIANSFADDFAKKNPGKDPSFGEMFSHVFGSFMRAEKKNKGLGSKGAGEPGPPQLDK